MRLAAVIAALAVSLRIASPAQAEPPPVIEQPRAFGHVLGDMLTQRLRLGTEVIAPKSLPPTGRIGAWFARQSVRIETDSDGQRWLRLDYQVINVPQSLATVALPALSLTAADGSTHSVPAWPISLTPLTARNASDVGDLRAVQPDRSPALVGTPTIERRLRSCLAALALVLMMWVGWALWRNRREAHHLPFARAWQHLHRLEPQASSDAAWITLHHALNEAAGHAVQAHSLPRALVAAPYLQPLQPRLQAFFSRSHARLFAAGQPEAAFPLRDLARTLYEAEKHHAG